ncbi:ABC transporter ATP-binding protein [Metabacillus sediminilitoris]|uniref:ABC transporter ATP-binding protein n=1 Tax=Metabacillus sediminilitoris TaxID=2567941 RepID=UPI0012D826DD|nr:ABC transporter ATP-binding protein [Metabacillus sediminilitoris]QGQ48168.1 ATP-binding cassette domain-containing protein [Metabacillus sediminilitoris]
MNSTDIAIEFSHVGKKYSRTAKLTRLKDVVTKVTQNYRGDNDFWALKDVSFSVKKGEAIGIIGSNGSGKSTLLKLLSGVTVPTEGDININGSIGGLIELGAGFHPEMTGRENVYINGAILGLSKKEIEDRFPQIIEFSGLEEFIDMPLKSYSSGMKVRLGFAVAITIETDIVLLDEVLAVGDSSFRKKALQMMESFLADKTIVFVSHDIGQIKRICDKCIVLNRGKLVYMGETEDAMKVYQDLANAPQASFNTRLQNYKTHLVEGVLLNEQNEETSIFSHGQDLAIKLKVNLHPKLKNPVIKVKIKADEISTFTDTIAEFVMNPSEEGVIDTTLTIKEIPLYNGKYNVDVMILNSANEIVEVKNGVLSFSVINHKQDFKMRGFINVPHNVSNLEQSSDQLCTLDNKADDIEIRLSFPSEEVKYGVVTFHKYINKSLYVPITHFTVPINYGQTGVLTIPKSFLGNGNYIFDIITLNKEKRTVKKEENVVQCSINDKTEKSGLVFLKHSWD